MKMSLVLAALLMLLPAPAFGQDAGVLDVEQPPVPDLAGAPAVTVEPPPAIDPGTLNVTGTEPVTEPEPPVAAAPDPVEAMSPSTDAPDRPTVQMPSLEDAQRLLEQLEVTPGQVSATPPDPSSLTVTVPSLGGNTVPTLQWPTAPQVQMPSSAQPRQDLTLQWPTPPSGSLDGSLTFPDLGVAGRAGLDAGSLVPPLSNQQLRDSIVQAADDDEPALVLPQASQGLSFSPLWLLMGLLMGLLAGLALMTLFRRRDADENSQAAADPAAA